MRRTGALLTAVMLMAMTLIIHVEMITEATASERTRGYVLEMDMNISSASYASFIGEDACDGSGHSVSDAGDVNGDGYDDILIGAYQYDDEGSDEGQTYLILGKDSGWSMDIDLSNADASFIGEDGWDYSGYSISGAGDVNGDGYDDILIGAYGDDDGGEYAGQTYLFLGKASGWTMDTDLANADASFWGEGAQDYSGYSVSGAGDVNGDGYDDILIGAHWDDSGGTRAGQTYLIFGKQSGWSMDIGLSNADASFIGEAAMDRSGWSVSGAGDVNGDGYDDILIGAINNYGGGSNAGQSYLILGKASGWTMDIDLSNADASFIGEDADDLSGSAVSGAGDVNGDGYDDILIGAYQDDDGGDYAGQTYLILGKASGWSMDTDLSNVDASFIGEDAEDESGYSVSGAGDVNGDGYDDILIGAHWNDNGGNIAGQTYLILGRASDWTMDIDLSNADASFWGEDGRDLSGCSVSGAGDVNGDGYDDMLIGASGNDDGGDRAGQTYLITGIINTEPLEVYSVKTYSDPAFSNPVSVVDAGESVYLELLGLDGNESYQDAARLNITFTMSSLGPIRIPLRETDLNTGIYRGHYKVPKTVPFFENITFESVRDNTERAIVMVHTPVQIRPFTDETTAKEDVKYRLRYTNFGYEQETWRLETNASWLMFDHDYTTLHGTPTNWDVGPCWVRLNITDFKGHYDEHYFIINVENTPPTILNDTITEATEDEKYYLDFDSDDDGQGDIKWVLVSNRTWLQIDKETGVLNGTPTNDDVGLTEVKVRVEDGNGGTCWSEFDVNVVNTNDPPVIITDDITEINQDDPFLRDYDAIEIDVGDKLTWLLETNALWLSLDRDTGELSGTPANDDVGTFQVKITVKDIEGAMDSREFEISVINVNDPPTWIDIPDDSQVDYRSFFMFDVNAQDVDLGTILTYSLSTEPESDMEIDPHTGEIEWKANVEPFRNPPYRLKVTLQASDGEKTISHIFSLEIMPIKPPKASILGPEDRVKLSHLDAWLRWHNIETGTEPVTYDLYVTDEKPLIDSLRPECCVLSKSNKTSFNASGLAQGKTYYWTVIPSDGCSKGSCSQGIRSFFLNTPPTIEDVTLQNAKTGEEFSLLLKGEDQDDIDRNNLVYRLEDAPYGMNISFTTGKITWTPESKHVGKNSFFAILSDGTDEAVITIDILVEEGEGEGSSIAIIITVIAVIAVICGVIGIVIFLRKRQKKMFEGEETADEEFLKKEDLTEDEEKLRKQMEELKELTGVALTVADAHAHDKEHHEASYEELYGSAPEKMKEETASTEETKEYIGEKIQELEKMEIKTEVEEKA